MTVYFAQTPTGSVKIGCTGNIAARMYHLRGHYGGELSLLHTMEGDRSTEAGIHERFAHLRFGRTEQFRPGPDLMAFIGKPLLVDLNPDAVEAARMVGKRIPATFRLSEAAVRLLGRLADAAGLSKTAILETLIRREAKNQGIRDVPVPDDRWRDEGGA